MGVLPDKRSPRGPCPLEPFGEVEGNFRPERRRTRHPLLCYSPDSGFLIRPSGPETECGGVQEQLPGETGARQVEPPGQGSSPAATPAEAGARGLTCR